MLMLHYYYMKQATSFRISPPRAHRGVLKAVAAILFVVTLAGVSSLSLPTQPARAEGNFDASNLVTNWGRSNNLSPNARTTLLYDGSGSYRASIFGSPAGQAYPPGQNNKSSGTGFKHILKNSRTTYINTIEILVYFENRRPGNKSIVVKAPERGVGWCNFNIDGNGRRLRVETVRLAQPSIRGLPPEDEVAREVFREPANRDNSTRTCNRFKDREYSFRNDEITYDPQSRLYVAKLRFILDGAQVNENVSNQVTFSVKAPGAVRTGVAANTRATNYGLLEDPTYGDAAYGFKIGVPFGVPCTIPSGKLTFQEVSLFDSDRDAFGDTYFYVLRRALGSSNAQRLSKSEYRYNPGANNVSWISRGGSATNDRGWFVSTSLRRGGEARRTSTVEVKEMSSDYQYMLVVVNPYQQGQTIRGVGRITGSPVGNVVSLSVPTDTITGEIECPPPGEDPTPDAEATGSVRPSRYAYYPDLRVDASVAGTAQVAGESHEWQQYAVKFSSKPSYGSRTSGNSDGCSVLRRGSAFDCETFQGTYSYPSTSQRLNQSYSKSSPDPIGTWTCFATKIHTNPFTPPPDPVPRPEGYVTPVADPPIYRYSAINADENCSLSVKYPKTQIRAHDLRTGGGIVSSLARVDNKRYGSWSEYGLLADGCNEAGATGSGASLLRGTSLSTVPSTVLSDLSFANTNNRCPSQVGDFGAAGNFDENNYTSGDETVLTSGIFDGPSSYDSGARRTYVYNGDTLIINKDLTYADSYGSVRSIPRIIIKAKNIIITSNVTRIDPWIIATGNLSTCDVGSISQNFSNSTRKDDGTITNICNRQITFNGPVMADQLFLHRTYGSRDGKSGTQQEKDDAREQPAEIFNLRPDAFLSSYAGNNTPPVATTDQVIELPPRF